MVNHYNQYITGVLNIAPVKLSGNYKLVVTNNNDLFLDDYNGRRYKLDKTREFLPQVANFLSTESVISENQNTHYGGFNHGIQKAFHTPLYIGSSNNYPRYFVLNRVGSKFSLIQQPIDLYRTANTIKLVDLKKIGIHNIMNEITSLFESPMFFNLEDKYVQTNGYGISELTVINNRFDITNNLANQPTLAVFNNQLLNSFRTRKMFYPKFLNLEFEFDDESNNFDYFNYFGYLGNGITYNDESEFNTDRINLQLYDYIKQTRYIQTGMWLQPQTFDDLLFTKVIQNPTNQEASVKYAVANISTNDYIEIYHPDGSEYFRYLVQPDDIRQTLRESLSTICKRATSASNQQFLFRLSIVNGLRNNVPYEYYFITIVNQIDEDIAEEYTLKHSSVFKPTNEDKFWAIKSTDVSITSEVNASNLIINKQKYVIVDKFVVHDRFILRLDRDISIPNDSAIAEFFLTKQTTLEYMVPVPYLSVNDDLKVLRQYDKSAYMTDLFNMFNNDNPSDDEEIAAQEAFSEALTSFGSINNFSDELPYVYDEIDPNAVVENTTYTKSTDHVLQDETVNHQRILNMMFKTTGSNGYISPNILNTDKHFWNNNGNLDYLLVDKDPIKYHWFLIKGPTPSYLVDDTRSLR